MRRVSINNFKKEMMMKSIDPNFLKQKTVVDSSGETIGFITDILGCWLEKPTYVEISITLPIFFCPRASRHVTCILFPISKITVFGNTVKLDRSKKDILEKNEFTPSKIMADEAYQIMSVYRRVD